ncbi:MAG: ABC transporter substrate-binding protein [Alphaproteobacteria bacterium]|jgi:TRAP-type mannitol/chloroaromatic compound transport system substrate-binding protein|nr:ABC transporter substrate-binding protein [Alphaproteobacteria bacterium]
MDRRRLLLGTAAGSAALATAASAFPAPAIAQDRIEWTMVTPWPRNAPGVGVNAQRVADRITEMSGGRLTVTLYAGGELVPPFEAFDAVSAGTADLLHATPYYWVGKSPALHFFTGVPFGLSCTELPGWIYYGGGQELWEEVYAAFGLTPFYCGSSGVQAGGWFRREIETVDDLRGLRIRIAGLGGEVMRRIGAAVVLTPPGEIFPAMQAGTVDAAEWVGPWNDLAFGLHQVADYYYLPAFHEPGPGLEVAINTARLAELPDDLKAIVRYAASSVSNETTADFTYHNIVSLGPLLEEHGVQLRRFSDEIVAELGRVSLEVLDDIAGESELTRRIHASYRAYLEQAARYNDLMDREMLRQRAMVI